MARVVRWADSAIAAFDEAASYVQQRDQAAALRMVSDIDRVATGLGKRHTGRPGRVSGTFEKSVPKWRYVIAYQIVPDATDAIEEIVILHVIHTSRNWPKGSWPT